MTVSVSSAPVHVQSDTLNEAELEICRETTGEAAGCPLGIAAVLALRALIASRALPDNAIMLGYRATWHGLIGPGAYRTEMSIAEADEPRTRYQRVVIGYRTYAQGDRLMVEQYQEVLWPVIA